METAFAQFQQPQPHHPQAHIQGAYPPNQNGNAPITSPSQQNIHPPPSQTSPLMSQGNPYGQHPGQNPQGHHQQIPYNAAGYGVQGMQSYGLSASQAAAMATAAASGPHYYGQRSPPQVPHQQAVLNNAGRGPPPGQQHQQSPDVPAGTAEEAPLYVNAKQFHRILKRRIARQKLEEQLRLTSKARKPYLHESRHNHAMRRPRGPGGRFLTSDEVAEMERKKKSDDNEGGGAVDDLDKENKGTPASGKRKAASDSASASKKTKVETGLDVKHPDANDDEDGEEDDDADDG